MLGIMPQLVGNFFFKIIDGRISFHYNNLDILSPPKFTFRHLKKGMQEFDRKFVLAEKTAKFVSEYDQEIPQSQTADNPVAPRGRAAQPSRDTRKTN